MVDIQLSFLECLITLIISDYNVVLKSIAPTKMKLKVEFGQKALMEDVLKVETIVQNEMQKNLRFLKLQELGWKEKFEKVVDGTRVKFV